MHTTKIHNIDKIQTASFSRLSLRYGLHSNRSFFALLHFKFSGCAVFHSVKCFLESLGMGCLSDSESVLTIRSEAWCSGSALETLIFDEQLYSTSE